MDLLGEDRVRSAVRMAVDEHHRECDHKQLGPARVTSRALPNA
jgi:hypothetical protein